MTDIVKVCHLFTALLVVLFSACQREKLPVAASDPIPEIAIYEDHSEALVDWLKKGYKGITVVNIDYHDDLRRVPGDKIEKLRQLAEVGDWNAIASARDGGADSLYSLADFIYPAFKLGIVKKLYWVTPSRYLEGERIEENAREMLVAFGYPPEVYETFVRDGDVVNGKILGADVTISGIHNLPEIDDPVLLTIDLDFFSNKILKEKYGELWVIGDFFNLLRSKKLKVRHLSIAYSVNNNYTDITFRHLGEEVAAMFREPGIAISTNFPELWRLRDTAFGLLREGQAEFALKAFREALEVYEDEPTLLLGEGISLALLKRDQESLDTLGKLASLAPEYDYAFAQIGRNLGSAGSSLERAEKYINEYLERHPDSYDGLMIYGDLLYNRDRDEDALKYYMKVLSQGDHIDAMMFAGDALAHLGRVEEAMILYEKGKELMDDVGYFSMSKFPESERNMEIINNMKSSAVGAGPG